MAALKGGNSSAPGFNRVLAANDTSNHFRNIVFDAAGSFFVRNSSNAARRPALSAPRPDPNTGNPEDAGTRMARRATDYWLTSLAPLGSVSLSPCC